MIHWQVLDANDQKIHLLCGVLENVHVVIFARELQSPGRRVHHVNDEEGSGRELSIGDFNAEVILPFQEAPFLHPEAAGVCVHQKEFLADPARNGEVQFGAMSDQSMETMRV